VSSVFSSLHLCLHIFALHSFHFVALYLSRLHDNQLGPPNISQLSTSLAADHHFRPVFLVFYYLFSSNTYVISTLEKMNTNLFLSTCKSISSRATPLRSVRACVAAAVSTFDLSQYFLLCVRARVVALELSSSPFCLHLLWYIVICRHPHTLTTAIKTTHVFYCNHSSSLLERMHKQMKNKIDQQKPITHTCEARRVNNLSKCRSQKNRMPLPSLFLSYPLTYLLCLARPTLNNSMINNCVCVVWQLDTSQPISLPPSFPTLLSTTHTAVLYKLEKIPRLLCI